MEEVEKLREIKRAHKLSYEDISKELGVSFQTVYHWFRGVYKPSKLAIGHIKKFIKKYNNTPIDR